MRRTKRTVLASALFIGLALSHGEAAAQFSGFYFFGDSLTDAGSFKPVLPPGTGKFTTNPGPVWAEVFAQRYGFTATPANQGGNDYAEGGARVVSVERHLIRAPRVGHDSNTGCRDTDAGEVNR